MFQAHPEHYALPRPLPLISPMLPLCRPVCKSVLAIKNMLANMRLGPKKVSNFGPKNKTALFAEDILGPRKPLLHGTTVWSSLWHCTVTPKFLRPTFPFTHSEPENNICGNDIFWQFPLSNKHNIFSMSHHLDPSYPHLASTNS